MTRDVNPMVGNCKYAQAIASEIRRYFSDPRSVIELGCGRGGNLAEFREAERLVGIDPLRDNVVHARGLLGPGVLHGDHTLLARFEANEFDVGFTCSVLDHIERFEPALESLCVVSKKVMLFEPVLYRVDGCDNLDRQARPEETSCWKTTWYHDYWSAIENMALGAEINAYPLYETDSGPLFHQFIIHSEQYRAKMDP